MSRVRVSGRAKEVLKGVVARHLWRYGYTLEEIGAILSKPHLWVVGATKTKLEGGK